MSSSSSSGAIDAVDFVFRPLRVYKDLGFPDHEKAAIARRQTYRARHVLWRALAAAVDGLYRPFLRSGKPEVLILGGARYFHAIAAVASFARVSVMVKGRADRLGCLRRRLPYIAAHGWALELEEAWRDQDAAGRARRVDHVLNDIDSTLARLDPAIVLALGNGPAVNRAVGLAARRQRRPVVSLQHGLYPVWAFSPQGMDGGFTDYWLVWGEHFLRMCIDEAGIAPERVHVVGYPYEVSSRGRGPSRRTGERTVCFLGQPWEHLDERLWPAKVELFRAVQRACSATEFRLVYRPHPREDRDRCRTIDAELRLTAPGESLTDAVDRYRVWLGVSSTALIDVALAGGVAGQLRAQAFPSEVIGRERGVVTVASDADSIADFLSAVEAGKTEPAAVEAGYVERSADLAGRLQVTLARIREDWNSGSPQAHPAAGAAKERASA